ncbi:MAG: hypothetical protein KDE32_12410 [Novosphingobium sp.]|nr:hypothetical protein [Novosphingobium sp.]
MLRYPATICPLSLAALLCACAGSGGQIASAPTPVTTTEPSTSSATDQNGPAGFYPLPQSSPLISYAAGINQSGEYPYLHFSIVGYDSSELAIVYHPETEEYSVSIPGTRTGYAREDTKDSTPSKWFRYFYLVPEDDPESAVGWVAVARKREINLTYTAIGRFAQGGDEMYFVTGIPTPQAEVPVTGSATYSAQTRGWTTQGGDVVGTLQLDLDFARAGLSGSMTLMANDGTGGYREIGDYRIADGAHPIGSSTFSGQFSNTLGLTGPATFEGSFMGPDAAEVGGRWQVPVRITDPYPVGMQGTYDAAGVFAGARK